ncbi:AraC family transcriptional regulator [Collinsella sp. An2]|uniref:helix-turn-helix transcriptional regulator n=1 Tax=Collinsella sp. An2 TaxID=1965585 RepID=UPI0013021BA4|nr:AraC family transcriptional regulator [Collinsella sp. An2]
MMREVQSAGCVRDAACHRAPAVLRSTEPLAAAYEPQVEQLGVKLRRRGNVLVGAASNELVDAEVFVYLQDGCFAITSHRVHVKRHVRFYEQGFRGLCLSSLAADCLPLCPVVQPRETRRYGNVVAFGLEAVETCGWMRAGTAQNATSIMLLPGWIDHLEQGERACAYRIMEEPGVVCEDAGAAPIDQAIRLITPLFGNRFVGCRNLAHCVQHAVTLAVAWHEAQDRAERASGTFEQARLVRRAKRLVDRNLSREITVDALARDLLTSRTRLCAAFHQETGMGLGAYIRKTRMQHASALLEIGDLTVAEIAREVGYPRPSSFDVAFKQEMGLSPTAWRMRQG